MTATEIPTPTPHNDRRGVPRRWLALCAGVAAGALALDQISKAIVRARLEPGDTWPEGWELIRVSHVHNSGAAFGMMQDATTFLTIASIVLSVVLVVAIYRIAPTRRWYAILLSLTLGGALGNLVERVWLGHVTDFIDPMRYPSFNLADSWIVIGVTAMLILSIFERDEEPSPAADARAAQPEHEASR